MTREALLKASITEFEDNKKNAEVYQCRRVPTDSGYVYLIKDRLESKFQRGFHQCSFDRLYY